MKIKIAVLAGLLTLSMSAFADLIYDAGEAPSHGPEGGEVQLKDSNEMGEAKQTGKNKVEIEKPYEYDANTVPENEIGINEKD